eukprot:3383788-Ditylum_brightwellii.AAC.2
MAQWVMKGNCNVGPRQTLRLLKVEELNSKTKIRSCNLFDSLIERRLGMPMNPPSMNMMMMMKREGHFQKWRKQLMQTAH